MEERDERDGDVAVFDILELSKTGRTGFYQRRAGRPSPVYWDLLVLVWPVVSAAGTAGVLCGL